MIEIVRTLALVLQMLQLLANFEELWCEEERTMEALPWPCALGLDRGALYYEG